jgi:hypothetical protein
VIAPSHPNFGNTDKKKRSRLSVQEAPDEWVGLMVGCFSFVAALCFLVVVDDVGFAW